MGLFTPAWDNPKADRDKIGKALRKITDQQKLMEIYRNAKNPQARDEAVLLISDDDCLVDYIVTHTTNFAAQTREAAAARIRSQEGLTKLACASFDRTDYTGALLAQNAAKKVTDRACLLKLLQSGSYEIRWTALKALDDQEQYAKAVTHDSWSSNAEQAFARIRDPQVKAALIPQIRDDHVLDKCLSSLAEEGYEPDAGTLEQLIARVSDKNYRYSTPAVARLIRDEKQLADIALHNANYHLRGSAIARLTDEAALAAVAMNENEDISNREAAYKKLKDKNLVDQASRDYIHSMDPEYWSEEDKRMADIMAADSY